MLYIFFAFLNIVHSSHFLLTSLYPTHLSTLTLPPPDSTSSIRVRQCYLQLETCPDLIARIPVLLNIGKYISSFPPIWLTAATSLGYIHPSMPTFITIAAVVNSLYSYLVSGMFELKSHPGADI
ncbi:hypothetical protein EON65_12895 [archaeon]|nr:MAG: hypothetical protein EON65_12895 [archaeon]